MAKTTISVPDELLAEIDRRATQAGTTRSGFVQEAAARYISTLDAEAARLARAERIGSAVGRMREIAEHMPKGTDGTAVIKRLRELPEPWLVSPGDSDQ